MRIIEKNKYYLLASGNNLIFCKPWKNIGSAIWNYNERMKQKFRGKPTYSNLKVIEIDVAEPRKSKFIKCLKSN